MAFSNFSNANSSSPGGSASAGGISQGPDLNVIQTEGLGFRALNGEAKVQLTSRWSPLPTATASLISVAAKRGLVAAAGPDAIYIGTTEAVRKTFAAELPADATTEVRPFEPQVKIPLQIRVSQVAFTADEQYLIACAESGGGLAVYDVNDLNRGATNRAFEINTDGEAVRALIPNPAPSSELAIFCIIVTVKGNLLVANLAQQGLVSGPSGFVLRSQVSCASWSTKGKQLVAGMSDGSLHQLTPEGVGKAVIPKPPSLGEYYVSTVSWLENHKFLAIHNSLNGEGSAVYHLISRGVQPGTAASTFTFQKVTDPVEPFGSDKVAHHTLLRLKDFAPNLQDLLVVTSTATESVGLLTRSKTALSNDKPADQITDVFTTTELADDSKRAQLPMSEDMIETFAIGAALDLSAREKVHKPIPSDEIESSPGPLPGLWILNNEGVLSSWWIVYNESIRSGTTYSGLVNSIGDSLPAVSSAPAPTVAKQSPFGSAPTTTSAFGAPASNASPFGAPASANSSAFGAPAPAASAFGGPSTMGASPSPWASAASNTPVSSGGPAFGQTSTIGMGMGMGSAPSPWASQSTAAVQPAFGQSGFGGTPQANAAPATGKIFGSGATSSGFASFANKGGFASISSTGDKPSIFATKSGGSGFGSATPLGGNNENETAFPPPGKQGQSGLGSANFVLGTTFKADPSTANDVDMPESGGGGSLLGSGFGLSLSDVGKQQPGPESKDEDMDAVTPADEQPRSIFDLPSTTPTATPAGPRFGAPSALGSSTPVNPFAKAADVTPGSSPFGNRPAASAPPPGGNPFASLSAPNGSSVFARPSASTGSSSSIFGSSTQTVTNLSKPSAFGTPKIKSEDDGDDKENIQDIPEAPLPPESTNTDSKKESSPAASAQAEPEDAPLPPDFVPKRKEKPLDPSATPKAGDGNAVPEEAPLPPDFVKPKKSPEPSSASVPPSLADSLEEGELSGELSEDHASDDVHDGEEEDEEEDEDQEQDDEEEDDEAASEGSGVDVAKDLSPEVTGHASQSPGLTPQSSFDMTSSAFSTISRTETQQPPRSLFGEIRQNAPPLFPKHVPTSPRSPSPVRAPGAHNTSLRNAMRLEPQRSSSAPGKASQFLARSQSQQDHSAGFGISGTRPPHRLDPNVEEQRRQAAKRDAEAQVLRDPEYEGIQEILRSEIEPTLRVDEFLVVDSKLETVGSGANQVPDACEALWRDINRMVDRLGLNSRSLQAFILGHTTQFKSGGRNAEDLEDPDSWVLVEGEELGMVVDKDLSQALEKGRVQDLEATAAAIKAIGADVQKLRAREEDMRRIVVSQTDPDQVAVSRALPLSAEQASQQNELRRMYANFSKLLAETEEALTLLNAKIASTGGPSGRVAVPTVGAVMRTINKMTSMAEKRSGDIDVLESQLRRLQVTPSALRASANSPGPRSREGSPFVGNASIGLATPQRRSIMSPERRSLMSPERMRSSVSATPPRKKMSMYSEDEKRVVRDKEAKRKQVFGLLRERLAKAGPNVSRLRDDDA